VVKPRTVIPALRPARFPAGASPTTTQRLGETPRRCAAFKYPSALHQGEIDVGFVRLPVQSAELVTVPVLEEMLVAAIPQGMPYRKGLLDLRNEPFV
jgi:DNA-binding transcriptional LysR family regulator